MADQTVLISGGTGMVGTALTIELVNAGYRVIILTRNPAKAKPLPGWGSKVSYAAWNVEAQTIDPNAVANAHALVHLAGAGVVAKPWTKAYQKEIRDSRINSSRLLISAIKQYGANLSTVVSASAIGWYGADGPGQPFPFTEEDPYAPGFLGETCRLWEESIKPVTVLRKRLVICRMGIVLSKQGGALPEFKKPLALRVAGVLGNGKQMVSWIHIADLCGIFRYAIENKSMHGVYNTLAPNPVTNKELTLTLARLMYGKAFITLPLPAFVLKIMMGERSIEVLKSATVSAGKITGAGYAFQFPGIGQALKDILC